MTKVWITMLLLCFHAAAWSQQTAGLNHRSFPRFTLAPGRLDSYGLPISGARLCVLGQPHLCYQMPSYTAPGSSAATFDFGLDPRAERLPLVVGGSWVFFAATYSGGGSGTSERLAVLRYEGSRRRGRIVNLLPFVEVSDLGERAMWQVPKVSNYPLLIDANFIWGVGEGHFDRHRYTVEAWVYHENLDKYVKVFSYRTTRKSGGEGDDSAGVLSAERHTILGRLEAKQSQMQR